MRLDVFLKISRLIARRSLAREFCDAGLVSVNNLQAKSSKGVKANDEIEIRRRNRLTKISVLEIPDRKQLSKAGAGDLYKIISDEIPEDQNALILKSP